MTSLELTLIALCATLWTLGAHSTYAGVMLAYPVPGRLVQLVVLVTWPVLVAWVVLAAPGKSKGRHT